MRAVLLVALLLAGVPLATAHDHAIPPTEPLHGDDAWIEARSGLAGSPLLRDRHSPDRVDGPLCGDGALHARARTLRLKISLATTAGHAWPRASAVYSPHGPRGPPPIRH